MVAPGSSAGDIAFMELKVQLKEAQYKNAMNETEIANLKIQVREIRKEKIKGTKMNQGGYSMDVRV